MAGDLTFMSESIYQVATGPTSSASAASVSGSVGLAGSVVHLDLSIYPGEPKTPTTPTLPIIPDLLPECGKRREWRRVSGSPARW